MFVQTSLNKCCHNIFDDAHLFKVSATKVNSVVSTIFRLTTKALINVLNLFKVNNTCARKTKLRRYGTLFYQLYSTEQL